MAEQQNMIIKAIYINSMGYTKLISRGKFILLNTNDNQEYIK